MDYDRQTLKRGPSGEIREATFRERGHVFQLYEVGQGQQWLACLRKGETTPLVLGNVQGFEEAVRRGLAAVAAFERGEYPKGAMFYNGEAAGAPYEGGIPMRKGAPAKGALMWVSVRQGDARKHPIPLRVSHVEGGKIHARIDSSHPASKKEGGDRVFKIDADKHAAIKAKIAKKGSHGEGEGDSQPEPKPSDRTQAAHARADKRMAEWNEGLEKAKAERAAKINETKADPQKTRDRIDELEAAKEDRPLRFAEARELKHLKEHQAAGDAPAAADDRPLHERTLKQHIDAKVKAVRAKYPGARPETLKATEKIHADRAEEEWKAAVLEAAKQGRLPNSTLKSWADSYGEASIPGTFRGVYEQGAGGDGQSATYVPTSIRKRETEEKEAARAEARDPHRDVRAAHDVLDTHVHKLRGNVEAHTAEAVKAEAAAGRKKEGSSARAKLERDAKIARGWAATNRKALEPFEKALAAVKGASGAAEAHKAIKALEGELTGTGEDADRRMYEAAEAALYAAAKKAPPPPSPAAPSTPPAAPSTRAELPHQVAHLTRDHLLRKLKPGQKEVLHRLPAGDRYEHEKIAAALKAHHGDLVDFEVKNHKFGSRYGKGWPVITGKLTPAGEDAIRAEKTAATKAAVESDRLGLHEGGAGQYLARTPGGVQRFKSREDARRHLAREGIGVGGEDLAASIKQAKADLAQGHPRHFEPSWELDDLAQDLHPSERRAADRRKHLERFGSRITDADREGKHEWAARAREYMKQWAQAAHVPDVQVPPPPLAAPSTSPAAPSTSPAAPSTSPAAPMVAPKDHPAAKAWEGVPTFHPKEVRPHQMDPDQSYSLWTHTGSASGGWVINRSYPGAGIRGDVERQENVAATHKAGTNTHPKVWFKQGYDPNTNALPSAFSTPGEEVHPKAPAMAELHRNLEHADRVKLPGRVALRRRLEQAPNSSLYRGDGGKPITHKELHGLAGKLAKADASHKAKIAKSDEKKAPPSVRVRDDAPFPGTEDYRAGLRMNPGLKSPGEIQAMHERDRAGQVKHAPTGRGQVFHETDAGHVFFPSERPFKASLAKGSPAYGNHRYNSAGDTGLMTDGHMMIRKEALDAGARRTLENRKIDKPNVLTQKDAQATWDKEVSHKDLQPARVVAHHAFSGRGDKGEHTENGLVVASTGTGPVYGHHERDMAAFDGAKFHALREKTGADSFEMRPLGDVAAVGVFKRKGEPVGVLMSRRHPEGVFRNVQRLHYGEDEPGTSPMKKGQVEGYDTIQARVGADVVPLRVWFDGEAFQGRVDPEWALQRGMGWPPIVRLQGSEVA